MRILLARHLGRKLGIWSAGRVKAWSGISKRLMGTGMEAHMATWNQLKAYIHSNYKATDVSPRAIEMLFSATGGRSQVVYVSSLEGPQGESWASIDSAIGRQDSIDILLALRMVEDVVCGGLAHLLVRG